ncbi:hypothetical protein KKD52_18385 [Myxococcota bacterium]|nr:hypothetical protein [Myxococcota bacterium]MBU1411037.1 hypothetical protein [Myxococcota bacterium]MBU1512324.1 hypothetical protein [Myxococcota bacterium]
MQENDQRVTVPEFRGCRCPIEFQQEWKISVTERSEENVNNRGAAGSSIRLKMDTIMSKMMKPIQVISSFAFIGIALLGCNKEDVSVSKINIVFKNIIIGATLQKPDINLKDLKIEYLDVKCGLGEALVLDNQKNVYKLGDGINNFVKNNIPLTLKKKLTYN